jgi:hypothetical protein
VVEHVGASRALRIRFMPNLAINSNELASLQLETNRRIALRFARCARQDYVGA